MNLYQYSVYKNIVLAVKQAREFLDIVDQLIQLGVQPSHPRQSQSDQVVQLTSRERIILKLLEQGLTNHEIAVRLNIAPSTVHTHILNVFTKLHAGNRTEAIYQARKRGLLDE
jgi:DNA-binding NarL/FixJ family response regulator